MKKFLVVVVVLMLVMVCYGQLYDPETIWHRCGEDSGDWFGYFSAGIGDVNGDGFDDFVASNKAPIGSSAEEGHVLLFYGGNPPDTLSDMIFHNPYPYGHFGRHVVNVGDVNGDGSDDFTIQGIYVEDNIDRVFIYFGGDIIDTIPDVVMTEVTYWDGYGFNIEGVGDVNGDGYDDVAIHASNYPWPNGHGRVWIYLGGSPMDSIADWEREGVGQNAGFGRSIAGKGDLNGDNYDDLAVFEWTGYPNLSQITYYIFHGSAILDTVPDVIIDGEVLYPEFGISNPSALIENLNGDRFSDLIIVAEGSYNMVVFHGGDPMDTDIDVVLTGYDPMAMDRSMYVSYAGDVNHDGYGDIIASQPGAIIGTGLVYVYFGNPWMDGHPDIRWNYPGETLVDCGDINGDGVDDMMFAKRGNHGCIENYAGDSTFFVNAPEEMPQAPPNLFQLHEPYPNPFNNTVTIPFEIFPGLDGEVSLIVYNVLGQLVADLRPAVRAVMKGQRTGYYEVIWDGKDPSEIDVGSGVYIVVLHISVHRQLQKITLLR
jgi:hypothetical protein